MLFNELTLDKELLRGIGDAEFSSCMPVQEKTFEETLKGRDVYVQSQTGSGKTAAFLITVFEHFARGTFEKNRAVIIVPTRELAVQIEKEARILGGHLPYRIGSFYGGVGYDKQLKLLDQDVELIIGTPGRLIDLDQRRKLNFRDTSIVVIDEADRLFDMGFLPDLNKMLKRMPDREKRLTMLYSATLNTRVWQLAWEYMNDPIQIVLNPENLTVQEVNQEIHHVQNADKFRLLLGILKREQAKNVLVFTNTKNGAAFVSKRLEFNGYHSRFIVGDLPQNKRLKLIEEMKAGDLQILVATDVAARGLHIDDLPLVVNYDLPEDPEGYVHRIGRTARAGNTGKAVTLACERFVYSLEAIEELIDSKIPVAPYDPDLLAEDQADSATGEEIDRASDQRDLRIRTGGPGGGSRSGSSRSGSSRSRSPRSRSDSSRSGSSRSRSGSSRSGSPRSPQTGSGGSRSEEQKRTSSGTKDGAAKVPEQPEKSRSGADSGRNAQQAPNRGSKSSGSGRSGRSGRPDRGQDHTRGEKPAKVSSDASLEDRLRHYREKYGEDFKLVDSTGGSTGGSKAQGNKRTGKPPNKESSAHKAKQKQETHREPDSTPRKRTLLNKLFGRRGSRSDD